MEKRNAKLRELIKQSSKEHSPKTTTQVAREYQQKGFHMVEPICDNGMTMYDHMYNQ